ncbi:MAG: potassium transporter TrkH, partial [Deltaproteobacteria bacterium]|nr:potassium transporter TrkH [Deltaproteobacteria bacterium]
DGGVPGGITRLSVFGGLGYFVIEDVFRVLGAKVTRFCLRRRGPFPTEADAEKASPVRLHYYSRVVLKTTAFLLVSGTAVVFFLEAGNTVWKGDSFSERALTALFQSVTSRTAGFATVDMAHLTDATLLATIVLMFIGGSPGSSAGGIKTTTFRILWSNLVAQLRGHGQVVVAGRAMAPRICNKAMLLFGWAVLTVVFATFALMLTENGGAHYGASPVRFMDIFFEVVSAFGTVGLSINLTPHLSDAGKCILCAVMFVGKLGPVWLITTIQQFQTEPAYRYPEETMPVG